MAVFYKLYQDNRTNAKFKGQWYARAVHTGTVDIDDLAEEMQANCTVKRADIVAVLSELVETMKKHLQMSHRVKLDRLGTFKIGMTTKAAETVEDFSASNNVTSVHVLFQPETKIEKNKTRVRALLSGCKVQETAQKRRRLSPRRRRAGSLTSYSAGLPKPVRQATATGSLTTETAH